jgi:hypothetical protein
VTKYWEVAMEVARNMDVDTATVYMNDASIVDQSNKPVPFFQFCLRARLLMVCLAQGLFCRQVQASARVSSWFDQTSQFADYVPF